MTFNEAMIIGLLLGIYLMAVFTTLHVKEIRRDVKEIKKANSGGSR